MLDSFREGGWGMFPTLAFGLLLLGVAVRYAVDPSRRYLPLLASLGVLTLAGGALGFVTGVIKSIQAVSMGGAARPVLSLIGAGEALNNVGLALALIVLSALATSAGALRIAQRGEGAAAR